MEQFLKLFIEENAMVRFVLLSKSLHIYQLFFEQGLVPEAFAKTITKTKLNHVCFQLNHAKLLQW